MPPLSGVSDPDNEIANMEEFIVDDLYRAMTPVEILAFHDTWGINGCNSIFEVLNSLEKMRYIYDED